MFDWTHKIIGSLQSQTLCFIQDVYKTLPEPYYYKYMTAEITDCKAGAKIIVGYQNMIVKWQGAEDLVPVSVFWDELTKRGFHTNDV